VVTDLTVWSAYIEALEQERAELVAALEPRASNELIAAAQRLSARLSVRLDASPLEDATAEAVDRGDLRPRERDQPLPHDRGNGASWARALKLNGMPTQDIAAVEYQGVRAAQMEEARLATEFFASPIATLVQLQRRIAAGLVDEHRLGALRTTSRAVNDGAQGRVIYHAPDPRRLPALLSELEDWVRHARDRHAPLAVAGVVHLRILQWRPFEAGNGRVARAASRVALRATAGDPWGVAVPEQQYARDPLRYVSEVAATIRRRADLRPWIELTGEAVVAGLEAIARQAGVTAPTVPARGVHECQQLRPGETITVPVYAAAVDCDHRSAIDQLSRLCWAGLLERDAGTHGLRYARRQVDGGR
jgi:fido (protein-threonine AMPylation protein)